VHNISDIIGGFVVAITFTTPFAIKAIGLHGCIKRLIDGPDSSAEVAGQPAAFAPGSVLPVTAAQHRAAQGTGPAIVNGRHAPGRPQHVTLDMAQSPAGVQG
jgi:hypothetical protein